MTESSSEGDAVTPVNDIVDTGLDRMAEAGAELVDPVAIPTVTEQIEETTGYAYYATLYLNGFLEEREVIPYDSVRVRYPPQAP